MPLVIGLSANFCVLCEHSVLVFLQQVSSEAGNRVSGIDRACKCVLVITS